MVETLVNRILDLSQLQPKKMAVIFKKEQKTYEELCNNIIGIAEALKKMGVEKGDRICFSATSKPEAVATYLAIQLAEGVAVFLDKNSTSQNMYSIYHEASAKILLTDKPMKEYTDKCNLYSLHEISQSMGDVTTGMSVDSFKIHPDENDLAEILFTTGTTGKPKGVMLSYKSVYYILMNTIEGIGVLSEDKLLLPLPLNHSFALRVLRANLYQGAIVILQNGFTFAKEIENNVINYHCNALACVPASFEVMKGQMQDAFTRVLGGLRYIEFGAGSLSVGQRKEIIKLLPGVEIYNTWGSSESGGAIFCHINEVVENQEYIGALGKPLVGKVEVKILNSEGKTINSDAEHPGRMTLKGDMQMVGYWCDDVNTKETLKDGWLLTGDLAYLKDDYVFMLGRADDIINVGGEKVSPIEVENVASQYEYIKECACIGIEDPKGILGQVPALFLVAKVGYDEDGLLKFLSDKMERYKLPQKFIKLQALPRNRMQKIDRKSLRQISVEPDELQLMNPIVENILSRRSVRKFTDRDIPTPILEMILKCGYYAPSGQNMQSWKFTVLTSEKDILSLKDATQKAAQNNNVVCYGFENPKVLILISNDSRNQNGCQDSSCAAENIMLAARSYGIGSVWLNPLRTLREKAPVKDLLNQFGIPEKHVVWAMVALGYPISEGVYLQKKIDVVNYIRE